VADFYAVCPVVEYVRVVENLVVGRVGEECGSPDVVIVVTVVP
jgi:hypothetical protein